MQEQQYQQLTQYIQQATQLGVPTETIHANLLSNGWPEVVIAQLLSQQQPVAAPADPNRVRNAVLWIVGPFAALIVIALLQFIIRFMTNDSSSLDSSGDGVRTIINILSILVGMAAVPMMIIGPIIGIVKLSKK